MTTEVKEPKKDTKSAAAGDKDMTSSGKHEEGKTLFHVNKSVSYKLIPPPPEKLLNDALRVPNNKLGRLAENFVLLSRAKEEIGDDISVVGEELVEALKEAGKDDITLQVGKQTYTLHKKFIKATYKVEVKK